MDFNYDITPGHGIGQLRFGLSKEKAIDIIGVPDTTSEHKDPESGKTTVFYYAKKGITAYFEEEDDYCLSSIEIENPHMVFLNEKIYRFTKDQVVALLEKKDFKITSEEYVKPNEMEGNATIKDESLEFCISVDDIEINFYFFDDRLLSVQFGVLFDDNDEVSWPD